MPHLRKNVNCSSSTSNFKRLLNIKQCSLTSKDIENFKLLILRGVMHVCVFLVLENLKCKLILQRKYIKANQLTYLCLEGYHEKQTVIKSDMV